MLRIEPTDAFLRKTQQLSRDAGQRALAIRCRESGLRARALASMASQSPDTIVVRSRSALDQAERVIFDVAAALGKEVVREADVRLRGEPDEPCATLDLLSSKIVGRRLLVDGHDELLALGPDQELGRTQDRRRRAVHQWLCKRGNIFLFRHGEAPPNAYEDDGLDSLQDVELRNGAPLRLRTQIGAGAQSLLLAAYLLGDHEVEDEASTQDELRARIEQLLPVSARRLLRAVALHDRPLEKEMAHRLYGPDSVSVSLRFGLLHDSPAGLLTESGWNRWLRYAMAPDEIRQTHLELAIDFSRQCRNEDYLGGIAILEAHRHFVAAGEFETATKFVRYGVALLVDEARRLSRHRRYERASDLYGTVLVGAQDHAWPIGDQLRGYVKHYLHFNRARARAEALEDTERGYRDALDDWPGNALFWSRLVRAKLYLGHQSEALATLRQAQERVTDHPLKQTFLVARTVRGLLQQDEGQPERIMDAVRVWGDYIPDSELAREVFDDLTRRLRKGWGIASLHLTGHPIPLFFTREVTVRVVALSNDWLAEVYEVESRARGASPLAALTALETSMRNEARRLVKAFTHTLDATTRLRKRRLLSLVDVIASGVDADSAADSTWILGELARDNGRTCFHTAGNLDLWFEIEPTAIPDSPRFDLPYFAKVRTGSSGRPVGPVIRLDPGMSRLEEEIWHEWRRRLADEQ